MPIGRWLRGELREWAESLLNEKRLAEQGIYNSREVREVWEQHTYERRDYGERLWGVLMFQAWWDRWMKKPPIRQ